MNPTLSTAKLEWKTADTPLAINFDDVYFSAENGLEESRYVFLEHNQLEQRFQDKNSTFYIFESGFGTGLNFLVTWQLWLAKAKTSKQRLHFISVEKHPLSCDDLKKCLSFWTEIQNLSDQLIKHYPALVPGLHRIELSPSVTLDLYFGDITEALEAIQINPLSNAEQSLAIDAWFLDGFAPAKNPEMWTDRFFETMRTLSAPSASFSTFTAAGIVKRGVQKSGFSVKKVAGYGQKREMLVGQLIEKTSAIPNHKHQTPWFTPALNKEHKAKNIAIIGAGLAGVNCAWQLKDKGHQIDVFEKNSEAGLEASGNTQGILYAKISGHQSLQNRFVWSSHLQAYEFYEQLFAQKILSSRHGNLSGVLQLAYSAAEKKRFFDLQENLPADPRYWQILNSQQASDLAGINISLSALLMPKAGWLNPSLICKHLLAESTAHCHFETEVLAIEQDNHNWVLNSNNEQFGPFDIVIICNAGAAKQFHQCNHLPLQFIRGQTNQLPAEATSQQLNTSICHKGYLPPAFNGEHCFGSSFKINNDSSEINIEDSLHNIQILEEFFPDISIPCADKLKAKAGVRINTPDYLPLIGPAPNKALFTEYYQGLAKNAHKTIAINPPYHQGLFVNIAHGSRGLATTVLAANYLGQLINHQHPQLERNLIKATSPARFLLRDIIKRDQ